MIRSQLPRRAFCRTFGGAALVCLLFAFMAAADPTSNWKFDTLRLKNGSVLRGLILEETPTHIRFQNVRRHPGRATVIFTTLLARTEIDRSEKLSEADRQTLKTRLDELDPSREGERQRMEQLELRKAAWEGKPEAALRYDSEHFSLSSNAAEDIVRRCAVRLEQIYTAYTRFLPPRHKGGAPTTIRLHVSVDEYQKAIAGQGRMFINPAFFDAAANQVVCASDL